MRLIDADACIDYIINNDQHAWEALAYAPTIEAEPITTERAIEHLMRTGWLKEHDTDMIEKGMKWQKELDAVESVKHGR